MAFFLSIKMAILVSLLLSIVITQAYSYPIQTTSDGDKVNCVELRKQPAFNNILLKNHKLQEWPSEVPKMMETNTNIKKKWPQTWEAYVGTADCPEGTIPVRVYWREPKVDDGDNSSYTARAEHEYVEVRTAPDPQQLYGTIAKVNVWDPKVENEEAEFSLSQVWISTGNYETKDLNTIEVGWQVNPSLYQDNKPRLFTYWTRDAYNTTGSYNLQEPGGFIQINRNIVLGGAIAPVSRYEGRQYEITIMVWKDRITKNWWLSLGSNNSLIGYWPAEIFTDLADHAASITWGGEIVDSHKYNRHTKTQMGSGHYPEEGFQMASYICNMQTVDNNNNFQPIQKLDAHVIGDMNYYNFKDLQTDDEWGTYFFYGGPGYRDRNSGVASINLSLFFMYLCFSILIIF